MARLNTCSLEAAITRQFHESRRGNNAYTEVNDNGKGYLTYSPVIKSAVVVDDKIVQEVSKNGVQLTISIDNNTSVEQLRYIKEILQVL